MDFQFKELGEVYVDSIPNELCLGFFGIEDGEFKDAPNEIFMLTKVPNPLFIFHCPLFAIPINGLTTIKAKFKLIVVIVLIPKNAH